MTIIDEPCGHGPDPVTEAERLRRAGAELMAVAERTRRHAERLLQIADQFDRMAGRPPAEAPSIATGRPRLRLVTREDGPAAPR
jgi:hypothetical protein